MINATNRSREEQKRRIQGLTYVLIVSFDL